MAAWSGNAHEARKRKYALAWANYGHNQGKRNREGAGKTQSQLREAQRIAKLGHWVAYPYQNRLEWSDNVYDVLGIERGTFEPSIKNFLSVIHPDDVGIEQAAMEKAWETGKYEVSHRVCTPSGDVVWVHELGELTTLPCGDVQLLGTVRNITAEKHNEENLRILASTDALTGIANRRHFNQSLKHAFSNYHKNRSAFSIIIFDYDFFKSINDTYGHSVGDAVLIEGARVIQQAVRGNDLFARLGGEEFAVILYGADIESAIKIARKLQDKLKKACVSIQGQDLLLNVTASFGVAEMSHRYQYPDNLLNAVDKALYQAKDRGRNRIVRVSPD
ncbi:sensor domain-containing diguanylate cyclase [Aliidiomarina quisquiliarum]|uniref:sensor domain-containing diguanylate cyclase n=1 Tax=Aliidiomarina quisquiliarum TaxID=2938947 RepID=UPI00208E0E0E|nr:sensor domain-containing diguanylate cyclase [Aliidiomarina quisquiliarum]MCO4322148.1 sensor domain-containing diguanylate cyclase [Aliidiomarina quisquiliarum]